MFFCVFFLSRIPGTRFRAFRRTLEFPTRTRIRDIATTPAYCYGILHYSASDLRFSWGAVSLLNRGIAFAGTFPESPFSPDKRVGKIGSIPRRSAMRSSIMPRKTEMGKECRRVCRRVWCYRFEFVEADQGCV